MGRSARAKPRRLGAKLKAIRLKRLGFSQTEMWRALKLNVNYSAISQYETGKREPDVLVLLKYARLAGVTIDDLVDDKINLPKWKG